MRHISLALSLIVVLGTTEATAMPDTVEELREIIATRYDGDATRYIDRKRGDFRKMGCRNRADLVQLLLETGLQPSDADDYTIHEFFECAAEKGSIDALRLLATPETIIHAEAYGFSLLLPAIAADEQAATELLSRNGARWGVRGNWSSYLTDEGQILFAARFAHDKNRSQALQGFRDAGFSIAVDHASDKAFVDLVSEAIERQKGGGGLGNLLGGLGDAAIGVALGGSTTEMIVATAGSAILEQSTRDKAANQPIHNRNTVARYVTFIENEYLLHDTEETNSENSESLGKNDSRPGSVKPVLLRGPELPYADAVRFCEKMSFRLPSIQEAMALWDRLPTEQRHGGIWADAQMSPNDRLAIIVEGSSQARTDSADQMISTVCTQ